MSRWADDEPVPMFQLLDFMKNFTGVCGIDAEKEKLGKEMIEQCGGLPLAIILLGGLLAGKDTLSKWRIVHADVISSLMSKEGLEEKVSQVINQQVFPTCKE
uniref:Putative Splicing factor-related n=1 Tax=Davidia involucrata TaxID=16924 RepID=A0A5B7AG76_DAVIN